MNLRDILDFIKITSGTPNISDDSAIQVSSNIALFISGSISAALGTAFIGLMAWILITRHQLKGGEETRKIERLRLLHELDETFDELVAQKCVHLGDKFKNFSVDQGDTYVFETILTRNFKWYFEHSNDPKKPRQYTWNDGQRMARFLPDDASIVSTHALHRFVHWFRRLHRGYAQGLVGQTDLFSMWRQILPFITDGRFTYLSHFFGVTHKYQTKNSWLGTDAEPIVLIARDIIIYCLKNNIREPLDYLGARPSKQDKRDGRIDANLHEAFFGEESDLRIREELQINGEKIVFDNFDPETLKTTSV